MITGVHAILYSKRADEIRRFLGEVLRLHSVDAGGGWPIYAGPPLELAVHPTEDAPEHELFLMCDDIAATIEQLSRAGYATSPVAERPWGLSTSIDLRGGERIGLYEPRHPSPR